jgi:2',3'-cyclic-nucleotide 2'-phosphodiesterase (5'-nucleotidase family)
LPEDLVDSRAPLRLGDISIIHVTDVHSYISGHRHGESRVSTGYGEPWHGVDTAPQDADYADLLAFVEHMKSQAAAEGKDLWVVNSGDVVDGTGISNLSPVNGANLLPLLQQMPFDAVTIGNHELYSSSTVANMASSGFIGHWGSAYVTSNIQSADRSALTAGKTVGDPLGAAYTVLRGEFGRSILVLGFLYNMDDHCDSVEVVHAEDAVVQPWFVEAMGAAADVDAVVVLSHMDLEATELATIRGAVRYHVGQDKPLCAS